jgi:hypothetical protein
MLVLGVLPLPLLELALILLYASCDVRILLGEYAGEVGGHCERLVDLTLG